MDDDIYKLLYNEVLDTDVVDWLEANVIVPPSVSPNKYGHLSFAQQRYFHEPLTKVLDPRTNNITISACSQVGKSFFLINSWLLLARFQPSSAMMCMPTEQMASRFVKGRLMPMIEGNPYWNDRLIKSNADKQGSSINYTGMTTYYCGTTSPTNLSSFPAKYIWLDEASKASLTTGTKAEADGYTLLKERQKSFSSSKFITTSTPNVVDNPFWQDYMRGTQKHYFVKCPHCGEEFEYEFSLSNIRWLESEDLDVIAKTARYICPHCREAINDLQRRQSIETGRWVQTNSNPENGHESYLINCFLSPFLSLGKIAVQWVKANTSVLRESEMQNFYNSWLGLPYTNAVNECTETDVIACCDANITLNVVPDDAQLVVRTYDVGTTQTHYVDGAICYNDEEGWNVKVFGYGKLTTHISDPNRGLYGIAWQNVNHRYDSPDYQYPDMVLVDCGYDYHQIMLECLSSCQQGIATFPVKGSYGSSGGVWGTHKLSAYQDLPIYNYQDYALKSAVINAVHTRKIRFPYELSLDSKIAKEFRKAIFDQQVKVAKTGNKKFVRKLDDDFIDCIKYVYPLSVYISGKGADALVMTDEERKMMLKEQAQDMIDKETKDNLTEEQIKEIEDSHKDVNIPF